MVQYNQKEGREAVSAKSKDMEGPEASQTKKRKGERKMTYCNGYWIMTSAQYDNWIIQYNKIMDDPNSSDELLEMTEQFNNQIAIED